MTMPTWDQLKPRFSRAVSALGVTEAARRLYGQLGGDAVQQGRRSVYNWLGQIEPQYLSRLRVWEFVREFERMKAGTAQDREAEEPRA